MYFTQEDYKKIENWLHRNSVKDTEFQEALPFTGKEIVTVVQDGHNRKVNIQEFINQLYKHGVEDFLNVTNTYGASNITLKEAISLIPAEARKEGQVITFLNTDGNWEIYQFIGKLNQWNNSTLWNNPFDWEKFVIDSILPDEEDLTKSEPDAKGNSYLSLKDRKYEPDKYSGLGRKILRRRVVEVEDPIYGTQEKNLLLQADFTEDNTVYVVRYDFTLNGQDITLPDNSYIEYEGGSISDGNIIDRAGGLNRVVLKKNIINGKNILTQEMINKSNTIYEIRYDFDLNGEEITIPEGCVLDFNGGSISGSHTLTGSNTGIQAGLVKIFSTDVTLAGIWNVVEAYPEWFGAKSDGVNDDAPAINKTLAFGNSYKPLKVVFSNKVYLTGNSIDVSEMTDVTFEGTAKNVIKKIQGNYKDMIIARKVKNLTIKNLTFDGSFTDFSIVIPESAWALNEFNCCMRAASETTNVIFDNNIVKNFNYGICCGGAYESDRARPVDNEYYTEHITIANNIFELVKTAAIDTYNQFGLFISNNYFKNCGETAFPISIEPAEKRENMTSDSFSVESITDSYALSDGVTVVNNKIYNDFIKSVGGIKCFSGTIKVCIKDNFIVLAGSGIGIEIVSPVMATIDGNTIQNCIRGISIWGLPGIVTVSNNKILDAKQVTISVSRTTESKYGMLNVFGNYFKLADVTDVTSECSNCRYNNMTIRDNVFCNVSENNIRYSQRCALQLDFSNCRVYNNRLVKTKDTAVPYFIFIPDDTDYNALNAKIYDNVSEQPLVNWQRTSEPMHSGSTSYRPDKKNLPYLGFAYNDTTLGKMVFAKSMDSEGIITWADATGATV